MTPAAGASGTTSSLSETPWERLSGRKPWQTISGTCRNHPRRLPCFVFFHGGQSKGSKRHDSSRSPGWWKLVNKGIAKQRNSSLANIHLFPFPAWSTDAYRSPGSSAALGRGNDLSRPQEIWLRRAANEHAPPRTHTAMRICHPASFTPADVVASDPIAHCRRRRRRRRLAVLILDGPKPDAVTLASAGG